MTDIRQMVRTDTRRAGAVRRYHTWPTIQTQTVAEASWNVTRILLQIWPGATPEAMAHALLNDCGEIRTGDLPFPIKRDNPELKEIISELETASFKEQGIRELAEPHNMAVLWQHRVKVCDMIEMWEFGLDEMSLGNLYAQPIVDGTTQEIEVLCLRFGLSDEDRRLIREYIECRLAKTPRARA